MTIQEYKTEEYSTVHEYIPDNEGDKAILDGLVRWIEIASKNVPEERDRCERAIRIRIENKCKYKFYPMGGATTRFLQSLRVWIEYINEWGNTEPARWPCSPYGDNVVEVFP